jgi:phosphate starvation-inducible PhoH-like protein
LCGQFDRNLARIEHQTDARILRRGNHLTLIGEARARDRAAAVLEGLYARLVSGRPVGPADVEAALRGAQAPAGDQLEMFGATPPELRTLRKPVEPRTAAQKAYVEAMERHDLTIALGPAGTGKTFLATVLAVRMLQERKVEKLILTRPAVEAGERLGFLPGDLQQKVDPYLRPLYDALHALLGAEKVVALLEKGVIEIAPLAYMRGRTLADAFVILDEAQNTTTAQMRMVLTRLGEHSRMVVTGDPTQIDLPAGVTSGLHEAAEVLEGIDGVAICRLTAADVVRHPLVQRLVNAYAERDARAQAAPRQKRLDRS